MVKTITSKQDRPRARTAADIEQKYNFGQTFAEVFNLISDAQKAADEAKEAIDNLDHEQIFNLLTDNGRIQGVYRGDDGNVYINATYIKSGKLAAEFIDADHLQVKAANITGSISFSQLDDEVKQEFTVELPGYIKETYIDATTIRAPIIEGGTMNVNNNFIVDANGNLTLNGGIDLSAGSITWGGNAPPQGEKGEKGEKGDPGEKGDKGDKGDPGADATLPTYIKSTYIDEAKILSPTITGNDIRALQSFSVGVLTGDDTFTPHGHLGLAYGKDASDSKTYGVAMASAGIKDDYGMITYDAEGQYVIVTDSGVRLQAFDNNVTVTENNIYLSIKNAQDQRLQWINLNSGGAFYNDQEIATKYDLEHIDSVYGALKVLNNNDYLTGWIGSGSGQATDGSLTYGVAMAAGTTPILADGSFSLDFDSAGRYILVTSEGIKLKSGENTRITLTDNTISVRALNGATMKLNGSEVVTLETLRNYGLI